MNVQNASELTWKWLILICMSFTATKNFKKTSICKDLDINNLGSFKKSSVGQWNWRSMKKYRGKILRNKLHVYTAIFKTDNQQGSTITAQGTHLNIL